MRTKKNTAFGDRASELREVGLTLNAIKAALWQSRHGVPSDGEEEFDEQMEAGGVSVTLKNHQGAELVVGETTANSLGFGWVVVPVDAAVLEAAAAAELAEAHAAADGARTPKVGAVFTESQQKLREAIATAICNNLAQVLEPVEIIARFIKTMSANHQSRAPQRPGVPSKEIVLDVQAIAQAIVGKSIDQAIAAVAASRPKATASMLKLRRVLFLLISLRLAPPENMYEYLRLLASDEGSVFRETVKSITDKPSGRKALYNAVGGSAW